MLDKTNHSTGCPCTSIACLERFFIISAPKIVRSLKIRINFQVEALETECLLHEPPQNDWQWKSTVSDADNEHRPLCLPDNTVGSIESYQFVRNAELSNTRLVALDVSQVTNMPHAIRRCTMCLSIRVKVWTCRQTASAQVARLTARCGFFRFGIKLRVGRDILHMKAS